MIVVDPRRTQTARSADLHLQLRPGTNVALMNGILQQLIANNWIDNAYIAAHTRNFSALAAKVAAYTPSYVAGITGLAAADIQTAAQWIGQSPEVWSMFIQGVYQAMGGTDTVRLICAMHLITGKIGRPGSAPFSITGQSTAMSNRETGGSSALSGYRNYYNPDHVAELEQLWNVAPGTIPAHATTVVTSNRDLQPSIPSMVEMMRNGTLKVYWVACTNPSVTLPDLNKYTSPTCSCRRRNGARRPAPTPVPNVASTSADRRCSRSAMSCVPSTVPTPISRSSRWSPTSWRLSTPASATGLAGRWSGATIRKRFSTSGSRCRAARSAT